MIQPAFEILNQRGTPMFFSDVFANRPTAGVVGRIFISTDTYAFYRDTGTGWDLIGGPGSGTITGSGTIGTLPIWNGTQVIGDSSLLEGASKFTTTKDFQADGYYLSGMTGGSGALYWTSDRVTLANYNATGNVVIEAGGGQNAQTISGTNLSTTFYGNIIRNGGLSTQFLKADGSLDSNTYNTGSGAASQVAFWSGTNALTGENNLWWDSVNNHFGINTNTPATAIDVHHNQSTILQLNQTTATNDTRIAFQNSGSALWRIGNFYNAGANDWGIYDVIGAIQPLTIAKTTGQTFIGSKTTASGILVVNSASSDAHIQVVGANAPSIRIDNAGSGATQRLVLGLATATNNFIQGSTAGDICISTASASPLLFGMWQMINASEVMRISTASNLIIGSTTDNGNKFQVTGNGNFTGSVSATGLYGYILRGRLSDNYGAFGFYSNDGLTRYGYIQSHSTNGGQLAITADGGGQLIMDSRGSIFNNLKVGIATGTTAPSSFLQIKGGNGNQLTLDNSGERYTQISFLNNSSASKGAIWLDNTNSLFELYCGFGISQTFYSSANERMRLVSSTGNLLIGTTTDGGQKLQVNGTGYFAGDVTLQASSTTLVLNRTGGTTFGTGIGFKTSGTNNWIMGTAQASVGTDLSIYNYNTGAGALNITYGNNNIQIGSTTDDGEKLKVVGTSRFTTFMGVGTGPDASTMIYVKGADTSSTNFAAVFQNSAGTNLVRFFNNGKVNMSSLPTSSAGLSAGDIWNDAGTLKIV